MPPTLRVPHRGLGAAQNHVQQRWTVANAAERAALTVGPDDVCGVCFQIDPLQIFDLLDHDPVTWQPRLTAAEVAELNALSGALASKADADTVAAALALKADAIAVAGKADGAATAAAIAGKADAATLSAHTANAANPHATTARQVGAIPADAALVSGQWVRVPLIYRLRVVGTGTLAVDEGDASDALLEAGAFSASYASADEMETLSLGDGARKIRPTFPVGLTVEVLL